MSSIARSMKRHGLTTKPFLRLTSAVMSGDTKYYLFDISETGKKHTVAAHDFWRGAVADAYPDFQERGIVAGTQPTDEDRMSAALQAAVTAGSDAYQAALAAPEPPPTPPPAEPVATPPAAAPVEYVRVRDMKPGDIVIAPNAPKGRRREVIRVVRNVPTFALHYVWEGEAALRTSQHVPGARFILLERGDR